LGRDAKPIPLGSSDMTQAPSVPKWGASMDTPSAAQTPRERRGVSSIELGAQTPRVRSR